MKVRAIPGRAATALEVHGVVDGAAPWPAASSIAGDVVLDLGAVPHVDVDGVLAWQRSLRALGRDRVYAARVRPAVLALLGMSPPLAEGLAIITCFAPYVCAACKAPFEGLVDMRVDAAAVDAGAPPFHACPACGGPGAFDDDPKALFAALRAQGPLRVPDGVDALIEGRPDVLEHAQLEVELDVEGEVTALWLGGTLQRSKHLLRAAPGLRGPLVVVASDIGGTTSAGLDALRELLSSIGGEVVLARVTPQLAQGLATTLHGTGNATVWSGRLPYGCEPCQKVVLVDVELDALAKVQLRPCGAHLQPKFGDREVLPLASLPTARPSEEIRSYLGRHPHPPSLDRSSEWTQALGLSTAPSLNDPTAQLSVRTEPARATSSVPGAPASTAATASAPRRVPPSQSDGGRPRPRPAVDVLAAPAQTDDNAATAHDREVPAPRAGRSRSRSRSEVDAAAAGPPTQAPPPDETATGGRYEIIRRLGAGGMAETLLGRHVDAGGFEKRVVIKRILPSLVTQAALVDMFLHEARVAARIRHANVVEIFDFGRMGDDYYIVMEYVHGWDLASLLRAAGRLGRPLPIDVACRIAADVCAGLHAAHTAVDEAGAPDPIIHRDITPHNVLVSLDGGAKLSDFGIAKTARDVEATARTDPGSVKGKIAYLAPEVIQGAAPTTKIDIYAAGLTLYTALVGRNPYQRKGDVQTMYAVAQEPLPALAKERRDVPVELAAIVGRAVHRDPGQRFASAQALQLHLEGFLAARPPSPGAGPWLAALARDAGLSLDGDDAPVPAVSAEGPDVSEEQTQIRPPAPGEDARHLRRSAAAARRPKPT